MHSGRFVFSQLMEHLPPKVFRRCVRRYRGDRHVQSFTCLDQFLCLAFAQLTYRESLRDIEVCLRAHRGKLHHMGIRGGMARNTLANANRVLDRLVPEPGAFHVMDRGHVDFERLFPLHRRGAFFVVRAKSNMKFRRRHSAAADKSAGVRCDQTIVPAGIKTRKRYPQPLRRVGYYDAKSNQGISYRNVNNAADCVRGKRRPWGKCKKNESV